VRAITPDTVALFSEVNNLKWIEGDHANSPLAIYCGVDFELKELNLIPDQLWMEKLKNNQCTRDDIAAAMLQYNNVISEIRMVLKVVKQQ